MAGRPKMSPEEKAAAKAAREAAAKAGAPAAADRAEARSASKGGEKPKPTPAAPRANSDDLDAEEKALFLNHYLPAVRAARALVAKATADLRNAYKKAKAEGNFTKADFDTAFAVETAENEARERAKIARQLRIAKIMGSSLGAQLDLFLEPDRTPAADIAYEEGKNDAIQNKPARPKYDPSTEQARKYLEGYHSVSESRVKEGIGKLDPEAAAMAKKEAGDKVATDLQKAEDAKVFEKPAAPEQSSGVPLTRAQFKQQQEAAKAGKAN